ncbi:hypothetical protein PMAYCL1PPCAC_24146, partial [Pristionchus mayeri]
MNSLLFITLFSSLALLSLSAEDEKPLKGSRGMGYPSYLRGLDDAVKDAFMDLIPMKDVESRMAKMKEWAAKNGEKAQEAFNEYAKKIERNNRAAKGENTEEKKEE